MASVRPTASNVVIRRVAVFLLLALAALPASADAARKGRVTPAGWAVRPAGAEISVARTTQGFQGPLGSALSPGGQKILSVSSAATRINSADLFDLRKRQRTGTVAYDSRRGIGEAVFYGVTFSPGGKRAWASGGGQGVVHVYDVGRTLTEVGQIPTPFFPAGLAYGKTPKGDRIYVANNLGGAAGATNPPGRTVTVIDPKTNHVVNTIDLGLALQPYGVAFGRNGRKVYVTNWMGRSVSVIDTRTERVRRRILLSPPNNPQLADHPNAIVANPRRNEVYTANGNSDTVSVIDTKRERVTPHDGGRARPRRAHRLDAERARGRPRRQAALRRARGRERDRRARPRAPQADRLHPDGVEPDRRRHHARRQAARDHHRQRRRAPPAPLRRPVRGRRLLDRRPRLHDRGGAAEHEGRHQRRPHAVPQEAPALADQGRPAQQPREGADRGQAEGGSARSGTSST